MKRAHRRASDWLGKPSASGFRLGHRAGRGLLPLLLAGAIGCSWNENTFNPDAPPLSVSLAIPDNRASFQINESVPLDIVLTVPEGQGRPHAIVARILRGGAITAEKHVPDQPTRADGTERVYRVDFDEGLSKPGKYEANVSTFLRWSEPAKRGWPEVKSEPITFEVTK